MSQSESIAAFGAALAKVQADLEPAIKDAKNSHLGNRYADLSACVEAASAVLPKHGFAYFQTHVSIDGKSHLRTTLVHSSGEWVSGDIPLLIGESKGINPMQALGSATTYARRYGLSAIIGLTAEDDDGEGAGAWQPVAKGQERARSAAPSAPTPARRPAGGDGYSAPTPARKPFEGTPRTGKQLFMYAKDNDLLKQVNAFGKDMGFPQRCTEWSDSEVGECVDALFAEGVPGGDG